MHKPWRGVGISRRTIYCPHRHCIPRLSVISPFRAYARQQSSPRGASTSSALLPTTLTRSKAEYTSSDTIFALSTAPGRAAIAIIRVSGPGWLLIYEQLCPSTSPPKARTATVRKLHHPQDENRILDPNALILHFPAPRTVTGEDILEFHVHGGPAIVRSVLDAIAKCTGRRHGYHIRHAEPGEFTKRAFYNNKIDLTQAEALGDSLAAETEQQQRLAISGATSDLAERYEEWRRTLLYARGELEALIDFSEDQHFDEDTDHFISSVSTQVVNLKRQLDLHIFNASRGELLREGINVALLGVPNAGKSSLLNRIVGREAAIVSAEAGTTRDIVDVSVDLGGWLIRLGDMAGLRSRSSMTSDIISQRDEIGFVETEGIKRARERALRSDLVIVLLSLQLTASGSVELVINEELLSSIEECRKADKELLFVINKIDLLHQQTSTYKTSLSSILSRTMEIIPVTSPNDVFCLSCQDANIINREEPDPGGMQTFLSGLIKKFNSMTAAISGETADFSDESTTLTPAEARNYWTASLSVTHRQSMYLQECLRHLDDFLSVTCHGLQRTETCSRNERSHHVDGHDDLVGEIDSQFTAGLSERLHSSQISSDDRIQAQEGESQPPLRDAASEIDVVKAAEHLRYAADTLARITGRSEGGDIEDVLGVVFEK